MKNVTCYQCIFFFFAIMISCKKETTLSKFVSNPALDVYTQPIPNVNTDTTMITAIQSATEVERNLFLTQFDKDNPGLRAIIDKEYKTIHEIIDSAQREVELAAFDKKYISYFKNTWDQLKIDTSVLRAKYKKVLGHNNFSVGEFGTIVISNITTLPVYKPTAKDSIKSFFYWEKQGQAEDGGGIVSSYKSISNASSTASILSVAAGDGNIDSRQEIKIILPDREYQYLTFEIAKYYFEIICLATSFGGVSSSTASLDYMIYYNDQLVNLRNHVNITCIAPIIWASPGRYGTGQTYYASSMRNEEGLPAGEYKLVEYTRNSATAVLFSSSASYHTTFLHDVRVIMSK